MDNRVSRRDRPLAEDEGGSGGRSPIKRWGARLFPYLAAGAFASALLAVALGGVVRVTGSGLGCPDWPLCHGRLIPPPDAKAWIEYTHRLAVAVAGLLTVLMVVAAFLRFRIGDRVLIPVLLAPALLVSQAALGAYTVLLEIPSMVALAHMGTGAAFVGSLAMVVAGAGRNPLRWSRLLGNGLARRYQASVAVLGVASFALILSGAWVTRSGASLACPSFPHCGDAGTLQAIHMMHRVAASVAVAAMLWNVWEAWHLGPTARGLRFHSLGVAAVFAVQVGLGVSNVLLDLPGWARGGHVAVSALFFAGVMFMVGGVWQARAAERAAHPALGVSR